MAIYDTGRPYELRFEGSWTCAVIAFPRDAVGLPAHTLNDALLRSFPAGVGPGALLSGFVAEALRQADTIGRGAAERLGEAGLHLVAGITRNPMYLSHTLLANQSVAAIAARWCFVDQAHFTRAFRAQFGMTASSVRRNTMGSTNWMQIAFVSGI